MVGRIGGLALPGVMGGQTAEGVGKIVVKAAPAGGQKLEQIGLQHPVKQRLVAGEAEKSPFLPEPRTFPGFLAVMPGGLAEQLVNDPLPVREMSPERKTRRALRS